jgi:hypothetical protein
MPYLTLKINGIPSYLYAVGGVNIRGGKVSEPYVFKIKWNKGK